MIEKYFEHYWTCSSDQSSCIRRIVSTNGNPDDFSKQTCEIHFKPWRYESSNSFIEGVTHFFNH